MVSHCYKLDLRI
jgi:tetratricopeptide (TPR) repeat protein